MKQITRMPRKSWLLITILKSLDEMKKAAEKKKVGSVAVLTDEEGFAVVL